MSLLLVGLGLAEVREVVENGRFLRQEAPHVGAKRSGEKYEDREKGKECSAVKDIHLAETRSDEFGRC